MRSQTPSSVLLSRIARLACGSLLLVLMTYNMLHHSALADHEELGAAMRESARLHAPVTALYILGGDQLRKLPALRGFAAADAREIAEGLASKVRSYPPGAMDALFGAAQSPAQRHLQWSHNAVYLLLLVFGLLHWRRPQVVRLIKRSHR